MDWRAKPFRRGRFRAKMMRSPDNYPAIENPITIFLFVLLLLPIVFLGIRHYTQAHEEQKREESYRSTLRSYQQVLKPGTKRKVIEDYFRSKRAEIIHMPLYDATQIGEEPGVGLAVETTCC